MYDESEDDEEKRSKAVQNMVAILMLVLVVGLGSALFVMLARGKEEEKRKAAAAARAAAAEHLADSLRTRTEDSLRAARADSMAKFAPKTPATPTAGTPTASALTGAATATPAAPPPEPTHYGIAVGTFLTQDRANQEQTKLQGSTQLAGAVSEVSQDNVTQYRVLIGDYTDKKSAEK
jgi:cell division protein FtsN